MSTSQARRSKTPVTDLSAGMQHQAHRVDPSPQPARCEVAAEGTHLNIDAEIAAMLAFRAAVDREGQNGDSGASLDLVVVVLDRDEVRFSRIPPRLGRATHLSTGDLAWP